MTNLDSDLSRRLHLDCSRRVASECPLHGNLPQDWQQPTPSPSFSINLDSLHSFLPHKLDKLNVLWVGLFCKENVSRIVAVILNVCLFLTAWISTVTALANSGFTSCPGGKSAQAVRGGTPYIVVESFQSSVIYFLCDWNWSGIKKNTTLVH